MCRKKERERDADSKNMGNSIAGLAEERGQFFSSICAGIVLGLLAAPINVIKVPLQVHICFFLRPAWLHGVKDAHTDL